MAGETFHTTIDESMLIAESQEIAVPGLVTIFAGGKPQCEPIRLDARPITLGRFPADDITVVDDDRVSRRHTRITRKGEGVRITDLDSRNGTFVDGVRVRDETYGKPPRLLRLGQSLLVFVPDLRAFLVGGGVQVLPDEVVGPTLRKAREAIARASAGGDSLLLTGPSGAGKELAARAFHAAGSASKGPFIAVNCATIPVGLAERLLFGARKGAYSGATADAEGYVQAADGGTLFLDEVAELDISVQPKLLRVLELKEVVSLGASHPRRVDVRICAATLKDLRGEVQSGRFREDLYYRIGRPEVRVPSLSERVEELPWLVHRELERVDPRLTAHPSLVETCALRPWPGNVRELLGEIRRASREAIADGRTTVKDRDLSPSAGLEMAVDVKGTAPGAGPAEPAREAIEAALKREQGNVTRAARVLGIHRNQLRRWLAKNSVDPKSFGAAGDEPELMGDAPKPPAVEGERQAVGAGADDD